MSLPPQAQTLAQAAVGRLQATALCLEQGEEKEETGMKSKTGEDRLHSRAQHGLQSLGGSEGITPQQCYPQLGRTNPGFSPSKGPSSPVLIPAVVGTLPHWLTVPVLTPGLLPLENWNGRI